MRKEFSNSGLLNQDQFNYCLLSGTGEVSDRLLEYIAEQAKLNPTMQIGLVDKPDKEDKAVKKVRHALAQEGADNQVVFFALADDGLPIERIKHWCKSHEDLQVWILSPDEFHADQIVQSVKNFAGCTVVCEKPIVLNSTEGRRLAELLRGGAKIYGIDHYLKKYQYLELLRRIEQQELLLNADEISKITCYIMECGTLNERQVNDSMMDLGAHVAALTVSLIKKLMPDWTPSLDSESDLQHERSPLPEGGPFSLGDCKLWICDDDKNPNRKTTAAEATFYVGPIGNQIEVNAFVGKFLSLNKKELTISFGEGASQRTDEAIDLSDNGPAGTPTPHGIVFRELQTESPDMGFSTLDAIESSIIVGELFEKGKQNPIDEYTRGFDLFGLERVDEEMEEPPKEDDQ